MVTRIEDWRNAVVVVHTRANNRQLVLAKLKHAPKVRCHLPVLQIEERVVLIPLGNRGELRQLDVLDHLRAI